MITSTTVRPCFLRSCLVLALLWLGALGAGAVTVTDGPHVEVTPTTARVRWTTDVPTRGSLSAVPESGGRVLRAEATGVATQQDLTLSGLAPATKYRYDIGTAKKELREGTLTTAGMVPDKPAPAKSGGLSGLFGKIFGGGGAKPAAQPAPTAQPTPPAQETWGNYETLLDHYVRHGPDFRATSAEDYAAQAWRFLQRAKAERLPAKFDASDGTLRVWDPKARAFAAYNARGRTRTYFKPNSPDYFVRQPGAPYSWPAATR